MCIRDRSRIALRLHITAKFNQELLYARLYTKNQIDDVLGASTLKLEHIKKITAIKIAVISFNHFCQIGNPLTTFINVIIPLSHL